MGRKNKKNQSQGGGGGGGGEDVSAASSVNGDDVGAANVGSTDLAPPQSSPIPPLAVSAASPALMSVSPPEPASAAAPSLANQSSYFPSSSSYGGYDSKSPSGTNNHASPPLTNRSTTSVLSTLDGEAPTTVGLVLRNRTIDCVVEGSSAEISGGVEVGDQILCVDGVPVNNLTVRQHMKGPVGSRVVITVDSARTGRQKDVTMIRQRLWGNARADDLPGMASIKQMIAMSHFSRLEGEVARLLQGLAEAEQQRDAWKHEASSAREVNDDLRRQLADATANQNNTPRGSSGDDNSALRLQLLATQSERDRLEAEGVQLKAQLRRELRSLASVEIDRAKADFEEQMQRLEAQLGRARDEAKARAEEASVAHESVSRLETVLIKLQGEKDRLQSQFDSRVTEMTERANTLVQEKGSAEGRAEEQRVMIERLLLELQGLRDTLSDKDRLLAKAEAAATASQSEALAALRIEITQLEDRLSAERDRLAQLRERASEELSKAQAKARDAEEALRLEIANLQSKLHDATQRRDVAEGRVEELVKHESSLETELRTLRTACRTHEKEASAARADLERIKATSAEAITRLEAMVASLQTNDQSDRLARLNDQLTQARVELATAQAKLQDCEVLLRDEKQAAADARSSYETKLRDAEKTHADESRKQSSALFTERERAARAEEQHKSAEVQLRRAAQANEESLSAISQRLEKCVAARSAAETSGAEAEARATALQAELTALRSKLADTETQLATATAEADRVQRDALEREKTAQAEMRRTQERCDKAEARTLESTRAHATAETHAKDLENACNDARAQVAAAKDDARSAHDAASKREKELQARHQDELDKLHARLRDLTAELATLQHKLTTADKAKSKAEARQQEAEAAASAHGQEAASSRATAQSKSDELDRRVEEFTKQIKDLQSKLAEAERLRVAAESSAEATRAESASALATFGVALEDAKTAAATAAATAESQRVGLAAEVKALQEEKTTAATAAASKLSEIQSDCAGARARADSAEKQVAALQEELLRLRDQLDKTSRQLDDVRKDKEVAKSECKTSEATRKRDADSNQKTFDSMSQQLADAQQAAGISDGALREATNALTRAEDELKALRLAKGDAEAAVAKAQGEAAAERDALSASRVQAAEAGDAARQAIARASLAEGRVAVLEKDVAMADERLQREASVHDAATKELRGEIDRLREALEAARMESQKNAAGAAMTESEAVARLEEQLRACNAERKRVEDSLANKTTENDGLAKKVKVTESLAHKLQNELEKARAALASSELSNKEAADRARRDAEAAADALAKLQRELDAAKAKAKEARGEGSKLGKDNAGLAAALAKAEARATELAAQMDALRRDANDKERVLRGDLKSLEQENKKNLADAAKEADKNRKEAAARESDLHEQVGATKASLAKAEARIAELLKELDSCHHDDTEKEKQLRAELKAAQQEAKAALAAAAKEADKNRKEAAARESDLHEQVGATKASLAKAEARIAELLKELDSCHHDDTEKEKQLRAELKAAQQEAKAALAAAAKEADKNRKEAAKRESDLREQLGSSAEVARIAGTERDAERERVNQLLKELAACEKAKAKAESAADKAETRMQEHLKDCERETSRLQKELDNARASLEALQNDIACSHNDHHGEIVRLEAQLARAMEEAAMHHRESQSKDETIKELRGEMTASTAHVLDLERRLAHVEEEHVRCAQTAKELRIIISQLQEENATLRRKLGMRPKHISSGVGLELVDAPDGEIVVKSIRPNTPAFRCGRFQIHDFLVSVDGKSSQDKKVSEVSGWIVGEHGSTVTITMKRNSQEYSVSLERQSTDIDAVVSPAPPERPQSAPLGGSPIGRRHTQTSPNAR